MAKGFADLHNHQFANLGFGGLAFWDPDLNRWTVTREPPRWTSTSGSGRARAAISGSPRRRDRDAGVREYGICIP